MCGIYGVLRSSASDGDGVLAAMAATLAHRGRGGDGAADDGRAALGCRRLAIVDVARGAQPLANERGDVTVVCNGEIYNAPALRAALRARGHAFRTRSDAEVLPHLYEERGADFVASVDGMFAAAVWDAAAGRLVLARDRLGEKPLYWATSRGRFLFASEPKALLAAGVDRTPDWTALGAYLRSGWVASPASAFRHVAKLPPAGRLAVTGESVCADRYWDVARLLAAPPLDVDVAGAARAVRRGLARATRAALLADEPPGVFVSGGLDSAAVAALAQGALGGGLRTFSLGFDVPGFDERPYSTLVARALGTRHRTLTVTPALFRTALETLAPLLDEPLADPALVPTFLLARLAREDVKVVLTGEGADELFAGYPAYLGGLAAPAYRRLPRALRGALRAAAPALGAPTGNTTLRYLLRRFLEAGDAPPALRHRAWMGCLSADALAAIAALGSPLRDAEPPPAPPARSEVDLLLALDLRGYLP